MGMSTHQAAPATTHQRDFATTLGKALVDLAGEDSGRLAHVGVLRKLWPTAMSSSASASDYIDQMILARNQWRDDDRRSAREAPEPGPSLEGMHKLGNEIFKVQRSPTTGRLYTKRLVVERDCLGHETTEGAIGDTVYCDGSCQSSDDVSVTFEYYPGALSGLSEATRMSLDDAKAFGALYGVCCRCGRTLTDESSIAAGIGPVCAEKGGWA